MRAYLDPDAIVRAAVRPGRRGVPGLWLPLENPKLAEACERRITFIGPSADVLTLTGNKARAIAAAKAVGVPTLASATRHGRRRACCGGGDLHYPLFVKAVAGGGGRGMRRLVEPARSPRGDRDLHAGGRGRLRRPHVFVEQAVVDPRHIEVQILADAAP